MRRDTKKAEIKGKVQNPQNLNKEEMENCYNMSPYLREFIKILKAQRQSKAKVPRADPEPFRVRELPSYRELAEFDSVARRMSTLKTNRGPSRIPTTDINLLY